MPPEKISNPPDVETERPVIVSYGTTARSARLHRLLPARRPTALALGLHAAPLVARGDYEARLSSWDAGL